MAFWSVTSAVANGEGSQILLAVSVTGTDEEIPPSTAGVWIGRSQKIAAIRKWRFSAISGAVTAKGGSASTADGGVLTVDVHGMSGPTGSGTLTISFKVVINLLDNSRIAPNAYGASDAKILRLMPGWVELVFDAVGFDPLEGPQIDDVVYNVDAVGRLPSGSAFKLHAEAIAEYTGRGGPSTPLALDTWTNLAGGTDLVGGPTSDEPTLDKSANRPLVKFDPADPQRFSLASPPSVTTSLTAAILITPVSLAGGPYMLIGRYHYNTPSWRIGYDGGIPAFVYDTFASHTETSVEIEPLDGADTMLLLLRRSGTTLEAWINGLPAEITGSPAASVGAGGGDLTIGARETASSTWGEGFNGKLNDVALYDDEVDDLAASLILHQMAGRALIALGTPIPGAKRVQPYHNHADPQRRLTGRPIAVVNLFKGGDENPWGQSPNWRRDDADLIIPWLRARVREAFVGCDRFEIMFNRPGGNPRGDIVPTYVFGSEGGEEMILDSMWEAMRAVWDDCGYNGWSLSHYNDDAAGVRRGWFYTGGGLPLDNDGTIRTDGRMGERTVGPLTGTVYKEEILDLWTNNIDEDVGDERFRCFFLDASAPYYGLHVNLVHDAGVNENYTLVGEAVPTDDAGREAAPWFCFVRFANAPWWNEDIEGKPQRTLGYNVSWTMALAEKTVYFGTIATSQYPDLRITSDESPVGPGDNLSLGDIYRWIKKGAVPVAWAGGYAKVGAAWDYATGRLETSRYLSGMRSIRGMRV